MALYYCIKKCFVAGTLCVPSVKENGFQQYRFPEGFDFAGLMPIGDARYDIEEEEKEFEEVRDGKTVIVVRTVQNKIIKDEFIRESLDRRGNTIREEFDFEPCFELVEQEGPRYKSPEVQKGGIQARPPAPTISGKKVVQAGRGPGGMLSEGEELNIQGPIEFEHSTLPSSEPVELGVPPVGLVVPKSLVVEQEDTRGANSGPSDPDAPGFKPIKRNGSVQRRAPKPVPADILKR